MINNLEAQNEIKILASNIRVARKRRRRTLRDIAERTGVSVSTLSRLESGDDSISIGTVFEVLSALDLLRGIGSITAPENDVAQVLAEVRDIRLKKRAGAKNNFSEEDLDF